MAKSLFVAQIEALLTGDSTEVQALKLKKQVESALQTQIHSMEGNTISLEDAVDTATEEARQAFLNQGKPMSSQVDRSNYIVNLVNAEEKLDEAKEALAAHLETIEFLKAKYAEVTTLKAEDVADAGEEK